MNMTYTLIIGLLSLLVILTISSYINEPNINWSRQYQDDFIYDKKYISNELQNSRDLKNERLLVSI